MRSVLLLVTAPRSLLRGQEWLLPGPSVRSSHSAMLQAQRHLRRISRDRGQNTRVVRNEPRSGLGPVGALTRRAHKPSVHFRWFFLVEERMRPSPRFHSVTAGLHSCVFIKLGSRFDNNPLMDVSGWQAECSCRFIGRFLYLLGGGRLSCQERVLRSQLAGMPVSPNAVCFNTEECSSSAGSYSLGGRPVLPAFPFGLCSLASPLWLSEGIVTFSTEQVNTVLPLAVEKNKPKDTAPDACSFVSL